MKEAVSIPSPFTYEPAEELDAIQAYDAAKAEDDEIIPFDQAIVEIRDKPE